MTGGTQVLERFWYHLEVHSSAPSKRQSRFKAQYTAPTGLRLPNSVRYFMFLFLAKTAVDQTGEGQLDCGYV